MGGPETEVEENIPFSLERIRSLRSILCFPCETVHETHKTIFGDSARKKPLSIVQQSLNACAQTY